jgi:hypothetical protein
MYSVFYTLAMVEDLDNRKNGSTIVKVFDHCQRT